MPLVEVGLMIYANNQKQNLRIAQSLIRGAVAANEEISIEELVNILTRFGINSETVKESLELSLTEKYGGEL